MRCEAKLAIIEAIDWNAHADQVQQLGALGGKIGKILRPLIEMLTQNKFSNLMCCAAKLGKLEAIDWNNYAEKVQQLDALWGKNRKSRGYQLNFYAVQVQQLDVLWSKIGKSRSYWLKYLRRKFSNLMRCEAKVTEVEANDWIAYAEKVQQLDALWGKNRKSGGYQLKLYAVQVQQLDVLWGKICENRSQWLKLSRRTSSAT